MRWSRAVLVASVAVASTVLTGEAVHRQLAAAAEQGTPFISQPYDPARLAVVNSYGPKQADLDAELAKVMAELPEGLRDAKVTVASWEPRILVVDDFMTAQEADHMVRTIGGAKRLGSTAVVTTTGGAAVLANTVTSKIGSFPGNDATVKKINERITQLSFLPFSWGESLHVLHYDPGQYFRGHLDVHAAAGRKTSSRVATCFLYLSDVEAGGETYFPLARPAEGVRDPIPETCAGYEGKDPKMQNDRARASYWDGAENVTFTKEEIARDLGVLVRPKKGRAVLWWNRKQSGEVDWQSRHVGCPLIAGEKWAATRWIHYQPFSWGG